MSGRLIRRSVKASTGRDRQKAYMARLKDDPVRFEEHKRKERQRYHANKHKKQEPTDREIRQQRKKWRHSQRASRQRKQEAENRSHHLEENTPPNSPTDACADQPVAIIREEVDTAQGKRGRKQVRRDRSQLYRRVHTLEKAITMERRRSERYKKRFQRLKANSSQGQVSTPVKEMQKLIGKQQVTHTVQKKLIFGSAICLAIKDRYKHSSSYKEKQFLTKLVASRIKKYWLRKSAHTALGIPRKALKSVQSDKLLQYNRKEHTSLGRRISEKLKSFFTRDDNSRITTSKQDTVSKSGMKVQRRLLTDTLGRLHDRYITENPDNQISYSLFCKLKPFYVQAPTNQDRETCLCKLHENGRMLIDRLHKLKRLPLGVSTVDACVKAAVCENPERACFERKCNVCEDKLTFSNAAAFDLTDRVAWHQWIIVKEKRVIKGKDVLVQRTVKQKTYDTVIKLQHEFEAMLPKLCWHLMVIKHQFTAYRSIKEKEDACTIIVDFSENYTCGHDRAIQSVHYGASNNQITLHTGVAYIADKIISFCSISDSTRHNPAAIWAHMKPAIDHVKAAYPKLTVVHFWSDGPTTQYRNKQHFLFVSHIQKFGLTGCTWNYSEAGHGKGAADAIGGVIKRLADGAVNTGSTVKDAQSFHDVIASRTKVQLFLIKEEDIDANDVYIKQYHDIRPIAGTMKLHQVQTVEPGIISVRDLSCFCSTPVHCNCLGAHIVKMPSLRAPPVQQASPMHLIPEAAILMQASAQPEVLACNHDESGSEATAPNPPPIAEASGSDETTALQHEAAPNPPPIAESANGAACPSTKVDVGDYVVVKLGSAGKHYIGQVKGLINFTLQ